MTLNTKVTELLRNRKYKMLKLTSYTFGCHILDLNWTLGGE